MKCLEKNVITNVERICCEFMNDCVEINNNREKCNDVYDRYIKWSEEKKLLNNTPE